MSIIKTNKLNVGAVYVSDIQVSLKFYTEILGFSVKEEMMPGYLLTIDDGFQLYIEGGLDRKDFTDDMEACISLCFDVEGGIKAAHKKLTEAGVTTIGEYMEHAETFHMFRIADPDGNIIEYAGKP